MNGGPPSRASQESDVELMRTILGEHVPQSVILTCLNVCGFDVSAALNWYFMEVGARETDQDRGDVRAAGSAGDAGSAVVDATSGGGGNNHEPMANLMANGSYVPVIQSGLSLTLHSRYTSGMISKTDGYYATLTRGLASYDMLTPSNEKFLTIRLRKRGWRTANFYGAPTTATQRPYFTNGDVVTLECNGLWLKAGQLNKVLQWKPPSDGDSNKFVVRGLPLGRNLRPGDYFFLASYKWKDKEIVMRDERPVGLSSYNTSVHRCFLGLERIKQYVKDVVFYSRACGVNADIVFVCRYVLKAVTEAIFLHQADGECNGKLAAAEGPSGHQPPDDQCRWHAGIAREREYPRLVSGNGTRSLLSSCIISRNYT